MPQQKSPAKTAEISVENIGGIDHSSVEFDPGVTILTGRNATNRTSLLQGIMAAIGSGNATLKADADNGSVQLKLDGETYTRTLSRQGGQVMMTGEPYLEDPELADLFAFLLEPNESRQAVARGDDLREIIMRPIDTAEIEQEISELENKKDDIDERISTLEEYSNQLPKLEEEKQDITKEIADKEEELAEKKSELKNIDKGIEESKEENKKLDSKMTELQQIRSTLNSTQREIQSEKESLEALEDELEEKQAEFDDIEAISDSKIADLDQEMQRLRGQAEAIEQTINELQSIIQFNDDFLNDGEPELVNELESDSGEAVTDELLSSDETVTCWTCGSDVAKEQIESNLENLRTLHQDKNQKRQSIRQQIQELQNEKRELKDQQREYDKLEREIERLETEITERQETLESLQAEEDDLTDEISTLEQEVEELQEDDHSKVLEVQEEINYLEFQLDDLQSDLSNIDDEIESIQNQVGKRDDLEEQREEIINELADLRTRIDQLQQQSVEEFNDHMDAVLDLLNYENLERIWIERTQETVREGRRKVDQDKFALHVIRSTDSGAVYEDTVDHLSESEREVTGLIFALAGYLVHEVYETVPFMLIDSIEAIDSQRIADLVEYLEGYADYLVVALLEEDAAALDEDYHRISTI
jgi:DNA repair exonuclease SbcCD ATPase subunit